VPPAGYNGSIEPQSILCLIVADDLTGACDAAVPFAIRGYRANVLLDLARPELHAGVLAVSTDSRNRPSCDLAAVASAFHQLQPRIIFKKIDSLLRGNAGPEIVAALAAFGCDNAIITPAFPGTGRIVESGHLRVTEGPDFPPIDVAAHFRPHGLECFLAGDIITDEHLDRLVATHLAGGRRMLWTGTGGLAAALARALPPGGADPLVCAGPPGPVPVLFVIGSDHPVTLEQQRRLVAARPSSAILRLPCESWCEKLVQARATTGALFLSGGDTATAVCRAIGARAIELEDEISTGLPRGHLIGGLFDGVPVATKSGAFGPPDALIQVAEYFTCR